MATQQQTHEEQPPPAGDHVPARLARGALGARRRRQVLPLPEGARRHQLVPDARLGDADRVPRAGADRNDPRDVLQARSEGRVRVDPAHHERPLGRLARARHAPLGRVGLHHPHVHAHGARVPVRRVQVPARAELDHRCAAARDGPRRGLHRLPAAVGSDGVLGDDRRRQHQRHRADPRAVPRAVPARRNVRSAPTRCRASTRSTCC